MPRNWIKSSLEAEDEALAIELDRLNPSLSPEQVSDMVERHKEYHALFERRERADAIVQKAYCNRRGPILEEVRRQIRQFEALEGLEERDRKLADSLLTHLRRWEGELRQRA